MLLLAPQILQGGDSFGLSRAKYYGLFTFTGEITTNDPIE